MAVKDGGNRRKFLATGWGWLKLFASLSLVYPLLRFIRFRTPKVPRQIKVEKTLLPGEVHLDQDFVLFVDEQRVWAVSRICTHLGCSLHFHQEEGQLICPCHQSKFSPDGKRLAGPARDDLAVYPVEPLAEKGYLVVI
ncbi:MAG: ubiquinol-cytochrome c reductase iron-sulfur subunit [Thermodesulfobacteriota bacterium]